MNINKLQLKKVGQPFERQITRKLGNFGVLCFD